MCPAQFNSAHLNGRGSFEDNLPLPGFLYGWSSDRQMSTQKICLNNQTIQFNGGAKGMTGLGISQTYTEIEERLNAAYSIEEGIPWIFSSDLSAKFASIIKVDAYSLSLNFMNTADFPTVLSIPYQYGISSLNEYGQEVYQAGPAQFREICGDQYILSMTTGVNLFITLRLTFGSIYYSNNFADQLGGSFLGLFDAYSKIKEVASQFTSGGNLDVIAYQAGGRPWELGEIFGDSGGVFVHGCSLNKLPGCADALVQDILNYSANILPAQVNWENWEVINGTDAPVSYSTSSYAEDFGLNVGPSLVNTTVSIARDTLLATYANQSSAFAFVDGLVRSNNFEHLPSSTQTQLHTADAALAENVALLSGKSGVLSCYYLPEKCPDIAISLMFSLAQVDYGYINQFYKGLKVEAGYTDCQSQIHDNICTSGVGWANLDHGQSAQPEFWFPANASTYVRKYYNSEQVELVNIQWGNNNLTLIAKSTVCPMAIKSPDYDHYSFQACDNIQSMASCLTALGDAPQDCGAWQCNLGCFGDMNFYVIDNPM